MLRKLLFSVLVLSLFVAFAGTAFADTRRPVENTRDRVYSDRSSDQFGAKVMFGTNSFGVQPKSVDFDRAGIEAPPEPSPYAPDHACEIQNNTQDFSGWWYRLQWFGNDLDRLAVKYASDSPNHTSPTVNAVGLRMYTAYDDGLGLPDISIKIHDDNGGEPGAVVHTTIVTGAEIAAVMPNVNDEGTGGFFFFTLDSPASPTTETYWMSYGFEAGADPNSFIRFGGNEPGCECYSGFGMYQWSGDGNWYTGIQYGFPYNIDPRGAVDVCYEYQVCWWDPGPAIQFLQPMPGGWCGDVGYTGWGQRFSAINDTLHTVTVMFYIHHDGVSQLYAGSAETNTLKVQVWGDDGSGYIDVVAGPLATEIVGPGLAALFPTTSEIRANGSIEFLDVDFSSYGLYFRGGFFHVTANWTDSDPAAGGAFCLGEDFGAGGSNAYDSGDDWMSTYDDPLFIDCWWNGVAWDFQVEMCQDQWYNCQNQILNAGSFASAFGMGGNIWTVAQQVKGKPENRVEKLRVQVADETPWGGNPEDNEGTDPGNPDLRLMVWGETIDIYGDKTPGALIHSELIAGDDVVFFPGWTEVVIPDLLMTGDFWVGYELVTTDVDEDGYSNEWWNACMDKGPYDVNSGAWLLYLGWPEDGPTWIHTNLFGGIDFNNWLIQVEFCSVIVPEMACGVADWGTLQGNYQRTGHSPVGIGNAKCDLTLEWAYVHPGDKYGQYTGPIIYDNTIVATFRANSGTEYKTFDLTTKVEGYTITTSGNVTGNATVDGGVMYMSGGTSDEIVIAVDFASGTPIYTIGTTNALGIALGMGSGESNPYANFIVWNDGEADILYFSVDIGKVYAVYAADGTPYWAGPFVPTGFGSVSNRTGTLDESGVLFYGYAAVVGGDIIALDALYGTQLWALSDAGLSGNDAWDGGVTIEQFQAGMTYDAADNVLYAVSTCAGAHPVAGTLYQINASSGLIVNDAQPVNGVSNAVTPVLDVLNVLLPTRSVWVNGVNSPHTLQAYRKSDLTFSFGTGWGGSSSDDYMVADMLMTCEFEEADLIFFFSRRGVLHCINGDTGDELFSRRIADQAYGGAAGAIAQDGDGLTHLVYQDASSGLYDLTPQASRARLEVLRGNVAETAARGTVPFGSDPNYPVTFTNMYKNTGCEDLTGSGVITMTSNGVPSNPYKTVSNEFGDNALDIAEGMTNGKFKLNNTSLVAEPPLWGEFVEEKKTTPMNPAALALGFINDENVVIAADPDGDPVDVIVLVDQEAVGRGVFPRFLEITTTNDPDYWLDGHATPPEIMITFLGGCIMEFTALPFGYDQANEQVVFNSGRVVENGVGGFTIDGGSSLFQGMYLMAVSDHRVAWTIVSWIEGAGETSTWNSWLPDLLEGQCAPILDLGVALGNYSEDGLDYSNVITGNTVAYNSIDSVQNFTDTLEADGWNHANFIAPFDNDSTMGLSIEHLTLGAYDFGFDTLSPGSGILDDIGNATIEIMDFTERNGEAVPGWILANYYDWDIGANDTTNVDLGASLAWTYDARNTSGGVGGLIKLPFNFCSDVADPEYLTTLSLGITLSQEQGMWGTMGGGGNDVWFLDSLYWYASLDSSIYCQEDYTGGGQPDQAGAYIIDKHDFEGFETYRIAVVNFEIANYVGSNRDPAGMVRLAHTVNKWMGFGRGDVNNDNVIDMIDIIDLSNYVAGVGPGPIPFEYLGDVNVDGSTDALDVTAIADYYFGTGGCFGGEWTM